jgi:hypothetical protein
MQNQHRHHFLQLSTKNSSNLRIWWARRWMKYAKSLSIAKLYRMSIHYFLHFSTLNHNWEIIVNFSFFLSFSLSELLINLVDLILMILSHQSLNNLNVAIILFRIKIAYVCNLVCSFQSFFHLFVLSSLCSFAFCLLAFCSLAFCTLVLSLFSRSRSLFVRSRFSLCLFVAKFKIKSKKDNKNVYLTRIKINNIHWCHVFKIYFVHSVNYEMTKRVCFSQLLISKDSNCSFESIQRELRNRVVIYSWFDWFLILATSSRAWKNSRCEIVKTNQYFSKRILVSFFEKCEDFSLFAWW